MRNVKPNSMRALRLAAFAAALCGQAGSALAGGPLWVVKTSGNAVAPATWVGTVKLSTDQGPLSTACRLDEFYSCMLDENGNPIVDVLLTNADGNALVAQAAAQWSGVPTSSFRAQVTGTLPLDITGANVGTVIGAWNGGGIQVIYDADGSVISELTGGTGYGVLGIASPEYLAGEGSTQITEGWLVIGGSSFPTADPEPVSGVVTHELGHAINLAHTQVNGYLSINNPAYLGRMGPERAGPDQCGASTEYPALDEIETMYPIINPDPNRPDYDSPQMASVDVADDMAALSSLYPAANYASSTGTIKGRVVAKDGHSQLTGINVIARRVDRPFAGAISRISGDLTQGRVGPDGNFVMTGLVAGASYVLHIDEIAFGGFSTPKAVLLGPEEYWNAAESGDAAQDDACAATAVSLAAGEVRQLEIALNGIAKAPGFTYIPYGLASAVSDNGQKVVGLYGNFQAPFWLWSNGTRPSKTAGESKPFFEDTRYLGGSGFIGAISGNGAFIGGTLGATVESDYGPYVQERAAVWKQGTGWKDVAPAGGGCANFHSAIFDLSGDGSTAVGNYWRGCRSKDVYATVWNTNTGTARSLPKAREEKICTFPDSDETWECEGDSRANAVSADGRVIGGYESFPETGARVGVLWRGNEMELLRDPYGDNLYGGWAGEVMAVNAAGTIAVGGNIGPELMEAYKWTPTEGVTALGRLPGLICYVDWMTGERICEQGNRETFATSVSNDGKVILGGSSGEAAIYTPKMGWMLLGEFLGRQGVLEASRWTVLGAVVSGDGKTMAGTGIPLAGSGYQGFRLDIDQAYVCHGLGNAAQTQRVTFPDGFEQHVGHGDSVGLCQGQVPN